MIVDLTADQLVAGAWDRLERDPDGPLTLRCAWGVVIATAGNPQNPCTFGMVASIVGCTISDVHQALLASREQFEAGV